MYLWAHKRQLETLSYSARDFERELNNLVMVILLVQVLSKPRGLNAKMLSLVVKNIKKTHSF